jgi:lysozyme
MNDDLDRLITSLQQHEGFRALVYDDATGLPIGPGTVVQGNPTIGYGWALNKLPMSKGFALAHLRSTAQDKIAELLVRAPWVAALDDVRRTVLFELAYNLGVSGLLEFRKMLRALQQQEYVRAGAELVDSKWARDVGPLRSASLRRALVTGQWPTPTSGAAG